MTASTCKYWLIDESRNIDWVHLENNLQSLEAKQLVKTLRDAKYSGNLGFLNLTEEKCETKLKMLPGHAADVIAYIERLVPLTSSIAWDKDAFRELVQLEETERLQAVSKYKNKVATYSNLLEKLSKEEDGLAQRMRDSLNKRILHQIVPAASASDWTEKYLKDFGITVVDKKYEEFFGQEKKKKTDLSDHLQAAVNNYKSIYDSICTAVPKKIEEMKASELLVEQIVKNAYLFASQEEKGGERKANVNQIGLNMLLLCGYDRFAANLIVTSQQKTKLHISNDPDREARADECVRTLNGVFFFVVEEDKNKKSSIEPQLIAEAIATFQSNRATLNIQNLDSQLFPGIILAGMHPSFYKINVTEKLSKQVEEGLKAPPYQSKFEVQRYTLSHQIADWGQPEVLTEIFSCYLHLKDILVKEVGRVYPKLIKKSL